MEEDSPEEKMGRRKFLDAVLKTASGAVIGAALGKLFSDEEKKMRGVEEPRKPLNSPPAEAADMIASQDENARDRKKNWRRKAESRSPAAHDGLVLIGALEGTALGSAVAVADSYRDLDQNATQASPPQKER